MHSFEELRKEVDAMKTYTQPVVTVLGDAAALIQSSKPDIGENGQPVPRGALEELD
jgi:hypothetical protein